MNFFSLFKRNLIFNFKNKISIDKDKFPKNVSLDKLFKYYDTDKSSAKHGFTKFYTKHFNKFLDKKINFLEIGSATGASASSFIKYFKNSLAFCLDINLTLVKFTSKKINYYGIDSSNKKSLLKTLDKIYSSNSIKKFDFIIDDGSHILSDQLLSLNFLLKYIKKGGYYVIEDYKFPNYFKRCNDVNDIKIDLLIKKIKLRKKITSKILDQNAIITLYNSKIFIYKGKSKFSDILFIKKK